MEETVPIRYILTGDRIHLDGNEVEVLDKNLVPLGSEVGFCLHTKGVSPNGCSWQLFRWNDEVTRILRNEPT